MLFCSVLFCSVESENFVHVAKQWCLFFSLAKFITQTFFKSAILAYSLMSLIITRSLFPLVSWAWQASPLDELPFFTLSSYRYIFLGFQAYFMFS